MSSVLNKKRPLSESFNAHLDDWEETHYNYGVHKAPIDVSSRSLEMRSLISRTRSYIDRAPDNKVKKRLLRKYDQNNEENLAGHPFPSMDMCSFNTQGLIYFSRNEDLLYHESPIIYQWEDGRWDGCFHSWATRPDGTKVDVTYDFDYIALEPFTLSSCPHETKRLIRHWMETPERGLQRFDKALRRGKMNKAFCLLEEHAFRHISAFVSPANQWDSRGLVRLVFEKHLELGSDVLTKSDVMRLGKRFVYENDGLNTKLVNSLVKTITHLHNDGVIDLNRYEINSSLREKIIGRLQNDPIANSLRYGGVQ